MISYPNQPFGHFVKAACKNLPMAKRQPAKSRKVPPLCERRKFALKTLPSPYHEARLEESAFGARMIPPALRVAAMEVVVWDFLDEQFLCSQDFRVRLGLEEGAVFQDFLPREERAVFFQILRQTLKGEPIASRRIRWTLPGSSPRVLAIHTAMLEQDGNGNPERLLLLAQDLSVVDTAMQALQEFHHKANERVAHSKTLLQEVNHRLKNNLQIVCSLIHSHGDGVRDPMVRHSFSDIETRVRMIAHLHDRLARGFDTLKAAEILSELVKHITQTGALPPGRLSMDLQDGAHEFDAKRAMPFAMIANELLMNSMQHSPPGTPVNLHWRRLADASARLTIRNTCTRPHGKSPSGLGMEIVHALCRQLGAHFQSDFIWNEAVCHVVLPSKTESAR
jgi:two-component sensor histidine kinase